MADFWDEVSNLVNDVVDVSSNLATGGLLGFDRGFKPGVIGQVGVDKVKEITGAKAAEDALKLSREQFDLSVQQSNLAIANAKKQNEISNVTASNAASPTKTLYNKPSFNPSMIGDTKDFLGL